MKLCPRCRTRNPDNARFCKYCGVNLEDFVRSIVDEQLSKLAPVQGEYWICSACSAKNLPGYKFCDNCGSPSNDISPHKRYLQVFLCHSSHDKPLVRKIYQDLQNYPIAPWLDEEKLLPGQDWELEIKRAVRASDVIIVCISKGSVNKEGFLQKEIRLALDVAEEKPEGTIFLIPLKLEDCEVPERLRQWQWLDFNSPKSFDRLIVALRKRAESLNIQL